MKTINVNCFLVYFTDCIRVSNYTFNTVFLHLEKISKIEKKVQRKYKIRITHKEIDLHFSSTNSATRNLANWPRYTLFKI